MEKLIALKNKAKSLGFIVEDPAGFIRPNECQGVKIALYVATGKSMTEGYDFAGFDDAGNLVAVGSESGGLGAFSHGGWVWIKGIFGSCVPESKLSQLWD